MKEQFKIFDSFNSAALIISSEKIVYCNTSALDLIGCSDINQILNLDIYSILGEKYLKTAAYRIELLLKKYNLPPVEAQLIRMDTNTLIDVYLNSTLLNIDNTNFIFVTIVPIQNNFNNNYLLSDRLFSLLFENSKIINIVIELVSGKIKNSNKAAQEFYGYSSEEFNTKSIHDLNRYTEATIESIFKYIIEKKSGHFKEKHFLKNGRTRDVEIYCNVMGIGNPLSVQYLIHDKTEKNKIEKRIKENEEKYRFLVEKANDGIMILQNNNIVFINFKMHEITGYSEFEIINRVFSILFPADEAIKLYRIYNTETLENRRIIETVIKNKEGKLIDVEINSGTIQYNGNKAELLYVRDLTERKKTDLLNKKLNHAVEHSPNSIVITNNKGEIEYVNPKYELLTGYALNEVIGTNVKILSSDSIETNSKGESNNKLSNGIEWTEEIVNQKKNGEYFWEKVSVSSVKDTNGNVLNYIIVSEDATERKRNEKAILNSNLHLKILNECNSILLNSTNSNEMLFGFCDMFTNIIHFNIAIIGILLPVKDKNIINVLAYSDLQLNFSNTIKNDSSINVNENDLNLSISDFINENTTLLRQELICIDLDEVLNLYQNFNSRTIFPIKNNNFNDLAIILFSNKSNKETNKKTNIINEISEFISFGLDIRFNKVEKERIEELQKIEKEQLRKILSSLSDCVISINRENIVFFVNNAALSLLELDFNDIINQSIFSILKLYDENDEVMIFNPYDFDIDQKQGLNAHRTLSIETFSGNRRNIQISINNLEDENKNPIGFVILIKDITNKIRIETQMALLRKMEAVGQLAAGIAHEINTPMQFVGDNTVFLKEAFDSYKQFAEFIKQNIEIIESKKSDFKDEYEQKTNDLDIDYFNSEVPVAIDRTLNGIDRVRKIVLSMKNFAHSSGSKMGMNDLNKGIDVTITISKNEWKYVADLTTDFEQDLPFVFCSLDEINQVILNMIVNSSHSIEEKKQKNSDLHGEIFIKTVSESDTVKIIIQDNGNGIPKDKISRIYDPFYTTKEVGKGTGQGLTIAHEIIVNKHKGLIEVDSKEGEGTRFIISLPIKGVQNGK